MDSKPTPLVEDHIRLGAQMGPFGGWLMPIQYSGIIAEHTWCRTNACLFDICHMGEFSFKGNPQADHFGRVFTIDVSAIPLGGCKYGFMLNDAGRILDDLVIYRLKEDEWMVVVNAATTDADAAHIKSYLMPGAAFENISQRTGKLDLQGPRSFEALALIVGNSLSRLSYYQCAYFKFLGEQVIISRTGYTGELGYEIYAPVDTTRVLWARLLESGEIKPAGLGARDTLRLEMGYPLYGQDISPEVTPLEAGLDKFIDWDKDFIGKDALREQKEAGIKNRLICFKAASRRAPRHNYRIFVNDNPAGIVTSGSFSPSLGCGIGMGYVTEPVQPGAAVSVREGNVAVDALVCGKPFYKDGTARMKMTDTIKAHTRRS